MAAAMGRVAKWCTYKRATIAVCCVNLMAALYVLRALGGSFYAFHFSETASASDSNPFSEFKYSDDQLQRIEESIRIRHASEPIELVNLMKKIKKEFAEEERRWELSQPVKEKLSDEILQRLKGLEDGANLTKQREAVELWRVVKLEAVKVILANSTSNSSIPAKEAKMLVRALESDWPALLEDIGLWMPVDVINKENTDKPENEEDLEEDEIIPGRPLPPECHAEPHTDYDGAAVRWGLTHHKESAADCCQACFDQAKRAKPGETRCNIWVYCPSEFGCYSPDRYEHKHQECWLKQAAKPRLNFKDKYSEAYRNSHPTAPVVVPWISGVVGA